MLERFYYKIDWKIDQQFIDQKAVEYVFRHNYTENREAILQAIKYKYTYWPNIQDTDKVREQFIRVRKKQ